MWTAPLIDIKSPYPIFIFSAVRPPEAPPGLIHTFLIIDTNITAKLMWHQPVSEAPISSYRLVWGLADEKPSQEMDADTALTKVLGQVKRKSSCFCIKRSF